MGSTRAPLASPGVPQRRLRPRNAGSLAAAIGTPGWVDRRWRAVPAWWTASVISRWLADLAEAERGRLVLWLPVFMGAGILTYFSLRVEPSVWAGAAFAAAGFGGAIALSR